MRDAKGVVTKINLPGSNTTVEAINSAGVTTGYFGVVNNLAPDTFAHGYVRDANGVINEFDGPGSNYTYPTSISPSGVVVGSYADSSGLYQGFIREASGTILTLDALGLEYSTPTDINARGVITGFTSDKRKLFQYTPCQ